ncbi:unnamed protein product [Alternaria alternata]
MKFNKGDRVTINNGGNTYHIVINVIRIEGRSTRYEIQEEDMPNLLPKEDDESPGGSSVASMSVRAKTGSAQLQEVEEDDLCAA